jgi:DHA1 family bicyclomycin/chloramphenicol resistance-like MFS transporter
MSNRIIIVGVLGAVFMLAPFAIDMYLPALPTIAADLGTGIDQMEATVSVLLIGYALGQLILGPLSDRIGQSKILLAGLAVFIAGSILAGTAQSVEQLYVWRFVQAIGGAGSVVVFPMVKDRFDEEQATKIISYIMALTVVAPLVAPIIGAYVLSLAGWRAIFILLAAFGALTLIAAWLFFAPATNKTSGHVEFSFSKIVSTYRLVLSNGRILAHILTGSFAFAGLFAFVAGSPFVYISYFGVSPQNYAYLVGLNAIAMIGANLINAQLFSHVNPTRKTIIGAIFLAIAGSVLLISAQFDIGLIWVVAGVVGFVGALGFTATNSVVGALSILPQKNGTVSAINGALMFSIGGISSFAVSLLSSANAMPMVVIMFASSLLALFTALTLRQFSTKKEAHHA